MYKLFGPPGAHGRLRSSQQPARMAGASPALHRVCNWPILFRADVSAADDVMKCPGRVTESDHKTGETAEYEQNCCTEHCPSSHGGHSPTVYIYRHYDGRLMTAAAILKSLMGFFRRGGGQGGKTGSNTLLLVDGVGIPTSSAETKIKRTVPFSYRSVVSSLQCAAVAAARLP